MTAKNRAVARPGLKSEVGTLNAELKTPAFSSDFRVHSSEFRRRPPHGRATPRPSLVPPRSQLEQRVVDPQVLARGRLPGVVNPHPVMLNPAPGRGLRVPVERLAYLVNQGLGRVVLELEARALARRGVELLDRVV